MKRIIIASTTTLIVLMIVAVFIDKTTDEKINSLRFSNTQEWGDVYIDILSQPISLVPNVYEKITVAPPPINTSEQTREEIKFLHSLEAQRTVEKRSQIDMEIDLANFAFGGEKLQEIFQEKPETTKLILNSISEMNTIVLSFKKQFDRVRPNFLDSSLSTSISTPDHPAYPSGHATQSFFIALILSDLDPLKEVIFKNDAIAIAHNREIAGVHYPSDSDAGRDLATKYFNLLSETDWYKTTIMKARAEW